VKASVGIEAIVAFRSRERTFRECTFRGAKGNDGGTQPTARTLGRSGTATRSLIVAFRSCERTSGKCPFRGKRVIFSAAGCVNEPEIVANALRGGFALHYGHHFSIHLIIEKHVIQKNHNLGAKCNDGGTKPTARTLERSVTTTRSLIVAFRSCERTSGKCTFRGANGNNERKVHSPLRFGNDADRSTSTGAIRFRYIKTDCYRSRCFPSPFSRIC
jgi:hypothetical protein